YLIDLCGSKAVLRAGYKTRHPDKIASQLLGKTRVAGAIQVAMEKRSERTQITQDMVLKELWTLVQGNISDILQWDETGPSLLPSANKDPGRYKCVKRLLVELVDKVKLLELLMKHLGMFPSSNHGTMEWKQFMQQ
ncbi:MAG: terminase small subunit, partial [SAR324 cluster bacterium]|nr:terminase small subunit [SAR324 cluster bacterium]